MFPLFVTKSKGAPTGKEGRSSTTTKQSHVAICPFAYPPQPETFFLLSRKIAAANRDVQVTMFTNVFNAMYLYWFWDPEQDHNLAFAAVGDWTSSAPADATLEEHLKVYMDEIGPNLRKSFDQFEEEVGSKITYVVADAFLAGVCREIAEERGVSWSAVWNSSATSLASYMHADEIQRKIEESFINVTPGVPVLPQASSRSLNNVSQFLPGLPEGIPAHYLPYGVLVPGNDSPVIKLFQSMALSLPKAEAVLINSLQNLESSVATALLKNTFHFGGPFTLTLPFPPIELDRTQTEAIFSFLGGHNHHPFSVLYINLSDSNTVPDEELHALAEALEAIKVPFLWYIAPRWPRVELPEGFVERTSKSGQGLVVSHSWGGVRLELFEMKVLSHKAVGMQLRNGSWSSVMESIATGVPIICRPTVKLFDQALNATLVSSWEIGTAVEGGVLTKYSAIDAINMVRMSRLKGFAIAQLKRDAEEDAANANGNSIQNLNNFITLVTK
uniref:UGT2 n=1 Tax=Fagopyrum tataricum TaxID=62330 RepID=A0A1D8D3E3_FAGTA|nr:UGT2 [Fagopyrum tataricum]